MILIVDFTAMILKKSEKPTNLQNPFVRMNHASKH